MAYKLVMITNLDGDWASITKGKASCPKAWFHIIKNGADEELSAEKVDELISTGKDLIGEISTSFIKISKTKPPKVEKARNGKVSDFKIEGNHIQFKVQLEPDVNRETPSISDKQKRGFYIYEGIEQPVKANPVVGMQAESNSTVEASVTSSVILAAKPQNEVTTLRQQLRPAFFEGLLQTTKADQFENYTHYLIRLLGIHQADKFLSHNQAGKGDGFFKIRELIVLWDATLHTDFEKAKKAQITTFYNFLSHNNEIILDNIKIFTFGADSDKQVWIITRAEKSRIIKIKDGISIKEISVNDLIELYDCRLSEGFDERGLANKLRNLGE